METKKMILLFMIFCFSGIFALPVTMSLFGGQHCWYDLGAGENQVPCVKCHADVADELEADQESPSPHKKLYTDDVNDACVACHRSNLTGCTYASGDGPASTPGEEAHAASTVACMECHEYGHDVDPYYYQWAGGFMNFTGSPFNYNNGQQDYGSEAAHNAFIQGAITEDSLLDDSSEACVACHTTTKVTINFNVTTGMTVNVDNTIISNSSAYWNITSIAPSNYTTYTEEK
jgi:hypothetical protein